MGDMRHDSEDDLRVPFNSDAPEDGLRVPSDADAPEGAGAPGDADEESTRFHDYLVGEYRRFRTLAWVLGGCGMSMILAAVGLMMGNVVSLKVYNLIMTVAYLFILLMFITVFTRTRPFKRRIKELDGITSTIRDDSAPDGVRMEENPQLRDMDDLYKILERNVRTEVVPDDPAYRQLRRTWCAIFAIALGLAAIALGLYYFVPEANLIAAMILLAAFACVVVAFYVDRTKMKPMRNAWARRFGMTEMQMRDNFREVCADERNRR